MNKLWKMAQEAIEKIEDSRLDFVTWLISLISIIFVRMLVENWLGYFCNRSSIFIFYEITHNISFFLISYLLFVFLISKTLRIRLSRISNVLLLGFFVIISPPIIDHIISGGKGFWSFYKFDGISGIIKRFFTFFGDNPEIGITYGVRIEVALVLVALLFYSFIRKKMDNKSTQISVLYAFATTLISYIVFFILGTFPSYVTILIEGISKGFMNVSEIDIAQMFFSPSSVFSREINEITAVFNFKMSLVYSVVLTLIIIIGLYIYQKEKFFSFLKNIRLPQIIYHIGLLLTGIGMGSIINSVPFPIYFSFFNLTALLVSIEAVILSWLASVIVNDFSDRKIDEKTNTFRPLVTNSIDEKNYKILGIIFFMSSLFFASIINIKLMLLLIVYQAIAWLYSSWPIRLKRLAFFSTFVSAIASLIIFFGGYILASPAQDISGLPFSIILMLVFSYTFSLPIKDFKDIEGDRADGVYTVPVIFGEYWGKIIVGTGVFLSFLLSVILLHEPRLFWWAVIFGAISFWIVNKMFPKKKKNIEVQPRYNRYKLNINYRNIFWWMLGIVSLYGIIMVKIIFF